MKAAVRMRWRRAAELRRRMKTSVRPIAKERMDPRSAGQNQARMSSVFMIAVLGLRIGDECLNAFQLLGRETAVVTSQKSDDGLFHGAFEESLNDAAEGAAGGSGTGPGGS